MNTSSVAPAIPQDTTLSTDENTVDPAIKIKQQVQFCLKHPFATECQRNIKNTPPQITQAPLPTYNVFPPPGYVVYYRTRTNWAKIDGADMLFNGLGFAGNTAQVALNAGIITEPADVAIVKPATITIEALGDAYDLVKAINSNNANGLPLDLASVAAKNSFAERLIPYAGAGFNAANMAHSIADAQERYPIIIPIIYGVYLPYPHFFPDFSTLPITVPQ